MKKCSLRKLSVLFLVLTLLLSHVMCAVVAYDYASLFWCGKYGLCSAPASTAFLMMIPYGIGSIICAALAWLFRKKAR